MSSCAFITHQPVINKQRTITANRLLVHARGPAPGQLAAETLNALGAVWPEERTVFIGLAGTMPDSGLLEWPAPANAMVEIPAAALVTRPGQELVQGLQNAGVNLCLHGYLPPGGSLAAIDFRFVLADKPPSGANAREALLLALELPNAEAFDTALLNGFDGAAGWFFLNTRPVAKKLAPSHSHIVRLLNLVRKGAEVKEIEAALKQDVALSFKLLRYINSVGFGLSCEIQSFKHAVTILGYEKLNKWLSLLLVTASKDPSAPAMMQAAVVRGRFMELLGAKFFDKHEVDNLFITGAFSLLDVLLGTSMDAVLEEMHLPAAVADTLLRRDSVYKPFLDLALASEQDSDTAISSLAASLQLDPAQVNQAQLQALSFADTMQFT
ncbi:MAG: HDOD domain-containing protein [Rhodocyclaceae bacterium]